MAFIQNYLVFPSESFEELIVYCTLKYNVNDISEIKWTRSFHCLYLCNGIYLLLSLLLYGYRFDLYCTIITLVILLGAIHIHFVNRLRLLYKISYKRKKRKDLEKISIDFGNPFRRENNENFQWNFISKASKNLIWYNTAFYNF